MDQQAVQQFRAEVMARNNLPTIPTVLAKILQLVDAETASGKDLIAVVERDQALTGKLLRLANSAFFGQSRKVSTIPRAVVLLGFSTVRNLALSVKVWETLGAGVARSRLEELWRHAVAVAMATKALTTRLRAGDPEEAFTAGLLHDVGRLLLAMRFRDDYWRAVGGAGEVEAVDRLEAEHLGIDHAEVGSWVLEAWNLPPSIVELVAQHHAPTPRPGLPGLLAIADRLVVWTDLGSGALRPEGEMLVASAGERGLTPTIWQDVVGRLRDDPALGQLEG